MVLLILVLQNPTSHPIDLWSEGGYTQSTVSLLSTWGMKKTLKYKNV